MLRRVALVRTDVLEEPSASFIRVTIGELGTTLAATSNWRTLQIILRKARAHKGLSCQDDDDDDDDDIIFVLI
jgi:hypothetical protein